MENQTTLNQPGQPGGSTWKRTHPMVPIAAASVIVMSLVGVGVFTGIIPNHMSGQADQPTSVASSTYAGSAPPAPAPARSAPQSAPRQPYYTPPAPAAAPGPVAQLDCATCGRVESVQAVQVPGKATGVGAVAGGVGGAVLGNQVGNGNGRTAMTILGAAGGALAGNAVEKHVRKETTYQVNVRMDDGSTRTFNAGSATAYNVGERVKVDNGSLVRIG